ncbi:hypothetical protein U9M48_028721 [Paspalum notatum var. saurae]|uniref:Uncharacterized protein n=1 Tax=Paspalum notatum var. saurae TaxID=547442 RepID=A0AAQ3TX92_PASNO
MAMSKGKGKIEDEGNASRKVALKGTNTPLEGGVLKVSRGSLVVMKGDMKSVHPTSCELHYGHATIVYKSLHAHATKLWHMRLGHMSELGLQELSKRGLLDGCNITKLEFCEHCVFGKHKRVKFNTSRHTTKSILDYVHSDLWGPSRKTSLGGARYMLTIIDDYSRKVWPYFLKHKSEAFSAFKEWKVMVERQTEKKTLYVPYTPQQNGVAERMNRTIISKARCMLSNAGLHRRFWTHTCHCILIFSGAYSELRVFGCTAYAHVDNGKLEPRAIKCIFLGYKSGEEIEGNVEPSTYSEAISSINSNDWVTAMHDEMESLEKNGTWELKPIRCKWIFKRKEGISPSEEVRYKARLVAKGYSQIPELIIMMFSPRL